MLKELQERHSIRKFLSRPIEDEKIEELLRAAMQAPTARNQQTWRFIVITNRTILDSIPEIQPYTLMMKTAPCAILVIGDKTATKEEGYLYLDGAAAIQNILVESVHQGLGTCWCGVWPVEERIYSFSKKFKLNSSCVPIGIIAIGYAGEEKPYIDRFDPKKVQYIK